METFSRRAVIDADFETTVGNLCRALRETGMDVIARVDVRDHVWRQGCNMCRYVLLEAWSPDQAIAALRDSPDLGAMLMTTLAIYDEALRHGALLLHVPARPQDRGPRATGLIGPPRRNAQKHESVRYASLLHVYASGAPEEIRTPDPQIGSLLLAISGEFAS